MELGERNGGLEAAIGELLEAGDFQNAAVETVRCYGPEILGYLYATLRDEAAAEEVFSQFSEDLWKGLAQFRRQCSMRTWAYKLAWEALKRFRRDPYRRRAQPIRTNDWSQVAAEVRERTAPYLRSTVRGRVARLREQLSPSEQTLLILRVDRGLSFAEIAEVIRLGGRPVGVVTLRKRYDRVKKKLRRLAQAEGLLSRDE
jgi:RNA polymerase sigma-70 factor (ECF subfamily)